MTAPETIQIKLLSDTTFSRGEGTAGEVDVEIEHDYAGIPFLGGKTLRGLLRDSWLSMAQHFPELNEASLRIHGSVGSTEEKVILRVSDAYIDETVSKWIKAAQTREKYPLPPSAILAALTTIRYQTAEERTTGAPAQTTLRASRVIIRGVIFFSLLQWLKPPSPDDLRCLALSVLGTRHVGLGRNRGRGHVRISIDGNWTQTQTLARRGK